MTTIRALTHFIINRIVLFLILWMNLTLAVLKVQKEKAHKL